MLDKIKEFLKKNISRSNFDPSRFDDPVAMKTKWSPAKGGGSNFRTHKLVKESPNRILFKPTIGAQLFSFIFVIVGIAVPIFIAVPDVRAGTPVLSSHILMIVAFGLIFFSAGAFMYYSFAKPIGFDKMNGNYWKGFKKPSSGYSHRAPKNGARLSNIHALQLLSEYVRSDKSSYYSYELNLILKDGERLNVVDHGSRQKIAEDARELSEFLGVPVWDAT